MRLLQERIRREGKVLPGNIIKVDGFLNHRVDTALLREIAREFKRLFPVEGLTAVLTVEASGIPLATICAEEFGVPMVSPKKRSRIISKAACTKARFFPIRIRKR